MKKGTILTYPKQKARSQTYSHVADLKRPIWPLRWPDNSSRTIRRRTIRRRTTRRKILLDVFIASWIHHTATVK